MVSKHAYDFKVCIKSQRHSLSHALGGNILYLIKIEAQKRGRILSFHHIKITLTKPDNLIYMIINVMHLFIKYMMDWMLTTSKNSPKKSTDKIFNKNRLLFPSKYHQLSTCSFKIWSATEFNFCNAVWRVHGPEQRVRYH